MMLKKLTINLMVESVERSVKFYSDVLGFSEIMNVPGENGKVFSLISNEEVSIMLQTIQSFNDARPECLGKKVGGSILLYFDVEKVDELLSRVKKNNVKVEIEMHDTFYGTKEFGIKDPDGYLISFAEDQ